MRTTLGDLRKKRAAGRKISMLTCYEAAYAQVMDAAGVDALLVGDSLGMVVQGRDSTLPVTVQDIAYHMANLARGSRQAFLLADMPFGSYQEGPAQALRNAVVLMQAGAQMVKLEGGQELAETVGLLVRSGIPVCGHIGLMPSHVNALGGFRVQGKGEEEARRIVEDAQALEAAGAALVVIEAVPDPVARQVCQAAPALMTIGIGASAACDGQVLVVHDMLGLNDKPAKFVKDYLAAVAPGPGAIRRAFEAYAQEVASGAFPAADHVYGLSGEALSTLYGSAKASR
ncbi:MAG: 3-methyl-2-oxobutanoate hydroxymethyltransferase [Pigmentiphaga sp.]|nr:3-methyl-2-oxobutanoate hydroxymethyltransferase [Pigmentiphaga sp.]